MYLGDNLLYRIEGNQAQPSNPTILRSLTAVGSTTLMLDLPTIFVL